MIILDKFILKQEKEIPPIERLNLSRMASKENSADKLNGYFQKFRAVFPSGGEVKRYYIFNKQNEVLGVFLVYAINRDTRNAHVTVLVFDKHKFDKIDDAGTPVYGSIILHATLYLAEHEEELGFTITSATAAIVTLKNEGSLDTLLRYTRLRTCRKDLILADPEYWVQTVDGTNFLFLKYHYDRVIPNRDKYLK